MNLTQKDQESLLQLARESINSNISNKRVDLAPYSKFNKQLGVFVTLQLKGNLRGCIGYSKGYHPLNESIVKASIAAAFKDTRFEPVTKIELEKIKIEISILTKQELIVITDYHEYLTKIELGRDGLIIECGPNQGLFLPQVPTDHGWNITEYLQNLCNKAGMGIEEWKEPGTKIYKFQSTIFEEK